MRLNITENWEENSHAIKVNHLVVLCEIKEDYQSFYEDLGNLVHSKNDKNLIEKLYRVMQGKASNNKYKPFLDKHKKTIDILKERSYLSDFTLFCYTAKGKRIKGLSEDYFYEYLKNHPKDIDTIKKVASKVSDLGFDTIYYSEDIDFKNEEYQVDSFDNEFIFLENMEVLPAYLEDPIRYKTTGSCYGLRIGTNGYGTYKNINDTSRKIYLNTLVFDIDRLPDGITTDTTIGLIHHLATQKGAEYQAIKNSVNLAVASNDLAHSFEYFQKVTQKIEDVKSQQEIVEILNQMQGILSQLQTFNAAYENQVMQTYPNISKETMEKEKQLHLERRFLSGIDLG